MKKILVTLLLAILIIPCFAACTPVEDTSETKLTIAELESWCRDCGEVFFEGVLERDYSTMSSVSSKDFQSDFKNYFENADKKVWLEYFNDNYLAGSQAIPGTFLSSSGVVSLEYSIVCVDYTSGTRNWLLLYTTTLTFDIDTEKKTAEVNNPTDIFKLYDNMYNDFTTHVAASALGVTEDFDLSDYYYDEELGAFVPYNEVEQTTAPTVSEEPNESVVPNETDVEPVTTEIDIAEDTNNESEETIDG